MTSFTDPICKSLQAEAANVDRGFAVNDLLRKRLADRECLNPWPEQGDGAAGRQLREIGERVGLHFSAVGNAVQRVADDPTRAMAQALRELGQRIKNQES